MPGATVASAQAMITTRLVTIALAFVLIGTAVRAQTPNPGMIAAGADLGVLFPDEAFESTLTIDAFGEYYVTPRVSVRGMLGGASPGFDGRTEDHFRQVRLLFNGVYNWEYGTWHPYV